MPDYSFIAVLSDIHGNIDALDAVFADTERFPVREMVCLGDIVGYGPESAECVQRVMENCSRCVLGNHEAMVFLSLQIQESEWDIEVRRPIQLACETLSDEQMAWLKKQRLTARSSGVVFCHGSLHDPQEFNYLDSDDEAALHFAAQKPQVSFQGHTHIPAIWQKTGRSAECFSPDEKPVKLSSGKKTAINCGSVGQPRDGDPRACYVLYDPAQKIFLHRRVPYDIDRAQKRFKKAGLPAGNAARIALGG
jgi:diadenosine tetraphosphatase ApaH/serine/threonine PP2A family protein phosphatase